jgi:hypothetical protein
LANRSRRLLRRSTSLAHVVTANSTNGAGAGVSAHVGSTVAGIGCGVSGEGVSEAWVDEAGAQGEGAPGTASCRVQPTAINDSMSAARMLRIRLQLERASPWDRASVVD